jgi:two-component system, cell cycle sensor histidine kinase and response regulator CckA
MKPVHNAQKETVLLADDDEQIRYLVRTVLERDGYRVLVAEDGKRAIEVAGAHQGPIHLLLSDVIMPGEDGTSLARQLQAVRPDLRVMLMSAYDAGFLVLDTGWGFIHKPFLPGALVRKVREFLKPPPPLSIW